uniref:Uncharacterized protein n=1 Tax=Nelumbo nucifera TaxID=4432 RepID=A0A822YEU0_NELNU|nr:TPA_asm: hypothetical protein HUJ06_009783 [Nelumbo nucifera]
MSLDQDAVDSTEGSCEKGDLLVGPPSNDYLCGANRAILLSLAVIAVLGLLASTSFICRLSLQWSANYVAHWIREAKTGSEECLATRTSEWHCHRQLPRM